MSKRISRTRAEILEGVELYRGKYVLQTCSNCGGQGTYPSSMTPSGMCRLYCWQNRTPETYGKEIIPVDKYVARAQAADRREAKRQREWDAKAAERAEAEAVRAERVANPDPRLEAMCRAHGSSVAKVWSNPVDEYRGFKFFEDVTRRWISKGALSEAQWAAVEKVTQSVLEQNTKRQGSEHVGEVGDRLEFEVEIEGTRQLEGQFGVTTLVRMRDSEGNALVWFASGWKDYEKGARYHVKATVKKHDEFNSQKQTVVSRAVFTRSDEEAA